MQRLLSALLAEEESRYGGAGAEEPPRAVEFLPPTGAFLVAYHGDLPVGCGGLRRLADGAAEIKRMFVEPCSRGLGVGRAVLLELERLAAESGYRVVRLETGTRQPEALGLYRSAGYSTIPCWGAFASDPWSVCFEKHL